jgi:hypothetical protein
MKKANLILSAFLAFVLASCSVGVNKDLLSGLKMANNTLTYTEAGLQVNDQKVTTNEFDLSTKVKLVVEGVTGFTMQDSLVYPGASMQVIDKDGKAVLDYPDLFAQYDSTGVFVTDAEYLSMSLTIGDPMVAGETYHWKMKFWDKKGSGDITAEMDVKVK